MSNLLTGRTVALLETRRREEFAALIRRRGGTPLLAPSLREVPAENRSHVLTAVQNVVTRAVDLVVFQTGVGAAALLDAAVEAGCDEALREQLSAAIVVARGPKPLAALLHQGIRVDRRTAEPHTTAEVVQLIDADLSGKVALVVEYGAVNTRLRDTLAGRGADVTGVATYAWALPADVQPMRHLLSALAAGTVDAVMVTSASQIHNLFAVADAEGVGGHLVHWLNEGTVVAAIGPVTAAGLRDHEILATVQPDRPKMVPLVDALCAHFAATDRPVP